LTKSPGVNYYYSNETVHFKILDKPEK